jgi:protein-S-isoprenylcysteine O-methyltransferase Ste14
VLLPVISPLTVILFVAQACLQVRRAFLEEAVLEATFPEYSSYRLAVARFVPGVY